MAVGSRAAMSGGEANRGGGPASQWLRQNVVGRQRGQLLGHCLAILRKGDYIQFVGGDEWRDPLDGLLQHRAVTHQPEKLLGGFLGAQRPEARPATASQNGCIHRSLILAFHGYI